MLAAWKLALSSTMRVVVFVDGAVQAADHAGERDRARRHRRSPGWRRQRVRLAVQRDERLARRAPGG